MVAAGGVGSLTWKVGEEAEDIAIGDRSSVGGWKSRRGCYE
jgi:hypothetical protein